MLKEELARKLTKLVAWTSYSGWRRLPKSHLVKEYKRLKKGGKK